MEEMALAEKIHEGLRKHVEKTKAKEGKKKESKREVSHFRVEPAEGGHVVETHYKSIEPHYEEPHRSVHKSMASVAKHMKENCSCGACGTQETGIVEGGKGEKNTNEMLDD